MAKLRNRRDESQIRAAMPEMAGDTTASAPERERIERRAYELYQARGGEHGRADDDWLEAERELSSREPTEDQEP